MIRWPRLIISLILPQLAGALGVLAGTAGPWYDALVKPPLNPPSWLFGPVWTILYLMMGIALYLIWESGEKRLLWLFGIQLALNAIWSPTFFGLQMIGLALVVILTLLAMIITLIVAAWKRRPVAYLLIPYAAWVSFATYLNAGLWMLN